MSESCDVIVEYMSIFYIVFALKKNESERAKMKPSWKWYAKQHPMVTVLINIAIYQHH